MKIRFGKQIIFALLFLLAAGVASAADPGAVTVILIQGTVEVAPAGTDNWAPAQLNQSLKIGDKLRTGKLSRTALRSAAGDMPVRESSLLTIAAPKPGSDRPVYELLRGFFYYFTRGQPTDIEFRNRLASAAARGTEFTVWVDDQDNDKIEITVFDGTVELSNAQGTGTATSGQQAVARAGQQPTVSPALNATNRVQWVLHYPGVLNLDDLNLADDAKTALADSLSAYRSGDLVRALNAYPANRVPAADSEKIYRAALILVVGEVDQAIVLLDSLTAPNESSSALRKLIAAVRNDLLPETPAPTTASGWMGESYYRQSRLDLDGALAAARSATKVAPNFGFAWARLAELEFSFGRVDPALEALDQASSLSPRHASALALRGFVLSAQNRIREALQQFERAIEVDGALSDAWLGRGLCRIRRGDGAGGRQDLRTAAALEPNRAVLRSYLGKAFSDAGQKQLAEHEFELSRQLDANDPTVWLYRAIHNQQYNRINQAIRDLEHSQDLNGNRAVYRSDQLLDQDQAVRKANLASIYYDVGMADLSVREASRAVSVDYANYSAHLFLANSYERLRDPKQVNLRYETPALTEYLIANLLAPVGAGTLSPAISQQEYSRLFERDGLGVSSITEYQSSGSWYESGAQYGTFGNTSYSVEGLYRTDPGQRQNNDIEQRVLTAQVKQQITSHDTVLISATDYEAASGDVAQYYDQKSANLGVHTREDHEPDLFVGYHREWCPGQHTLFLAARLDDALAIRDPFQPLIAFTRDGAGGIIGALQGTTREIYRTSLEIYSAELQHIAQVEKHTTVLGGRFQTGDFDTRVFQNTASGFIPGIPFSYRSLGSFSDDFQRASAYAYHTWNLIHSVQLVGGLTYDHLMVPRNFRFAPLRGGEESTSRLSPKVGLIWEANTNTTVRMAYAQGLNGVSVDQSTRIEPSQVAGFNQTFRSVIPESAGGSSTGERFDTVNVSLEHKFATETYAAVAGEWLTSSDERDTGALTVGGFLFPDPTPLSPYQARQRLDFTERTLSVTLNQLLGDNWAFGCRYRVSFADLDLTFPAVPPNGVPSGNSTFPRTSRFESVIQQVTLDAIYNHPCGFFGQAQVQWTGQENDEDFAATEPGDDFWQLNAFVGYRFWRRHAEVAVGVLNITDEDYKLEPLNFYNELPRERTFVARFKFKF